MISNYEIKRFNGELTLFIYLDNTYEFAKLNGKHKKKKLKEIIKDFIEKNEIAFAGTTIAIVAGGLIIGNMFLNKNNEVNLNNSIISIHLNPENNITEVMEDNITENQSVNEIEVENDENKTDNEIVINVAEEKIDKKTIQKNSIENSEKIEIDTNEYKQTVTVFRSNGQVLNLELEEYLVNVVAAEMPASFNKEALKAQAVLARTYALKAIDTGKVLTDTVSTQVYKDNNELKNLWGNSFDTYYNKIKEAVYSTSSEVLKYNGDYIEAVYHSTSNGFTEDAKNVWGNSFPYLVSVASSVDKSVKNYEVSTFFSFEKLSTILGFNINSETEFSVLERNASNRVYTLRIGDSIYDGIHFRTLLSLRSADFEFEVLANGVNVKTRGYGHGVGMSQYGANEMAKAGSSYKQILAHYYKGTSLLKE